MRGQPLKRKSPYISVACKDNTRHKTKSANRGFCSRGGGFYPAGVWKYYRHKERGADGNRTPKTTPKTGRKRAAAGRAYLRHFDSCRKKHCSTMKKGGSIYDRLTPGKRAGQTSQRAHLLTTAERRQSAFHTWQAGRNGTHCTNWQAV